MPSERRVCTVEEQKILIDWVTKNYKTFTLNHPAKSLTNTKYDGYYTNLKNIKNDTISTILDNIKKRIEEKEQLYLYDECLVKEDVPHFIYFMEPGTKLHKHNDRTSSKKGTQIRFNVCIQKPEDGGRPIYANKVYDLFECEYIICRSGIDYHTSEIINGNIGKINISYGYFVNNEDVHKYNSP
jgi:hypothetical protein